MDNEMEENSEECTVKDIIPRDYQLELLEDVKKSNTILYLPTGSGKTFIATMLVKYMGGPLNKPLGKGRKWTFFVVQSIPLVSQQANSLRKHLPWNIGTFSGDMFLDHWTKNDWEKILENCHILVMTHQIYLNNLHHGFMNIRDANLIIFDECHHAVALHPFKQIMQVYHDTIFNDGERPHILGLTATLINSNSKNVKEDLIKLQNTYNSTIKTKYDEAIKVFSARPQEFIKLYNEFILDVELKAIIKKIRLIYVQLREIQDSPKTKPIVENKETFYLEPQRSSSKSLSNYFLDVEVNLGDSGVYVAYLLTWHYIIEIEKKKKLCCDLDKYMVMSLALSEMTVIRKMFYDYMIKSSKRIGSSSLTDISSPKLITLMELLSKVQRSDICLVFVDRRTTAKILYHFIKDYTHEHNQKNIECDFIVGARGSFKNDSKEIMYKKQQNNEIIKRFNDKVINVLITSEILEEGVDIQTCNYVIRYDTPKNFPSYVQSKGRARSNNSKFIVMVPSIEDFEKTHAEYTNTENEIHKILVDNDINDDNNEENLNEVFKTKYAVLSHDMAISILNRYCSTLPQDRFSDLRADWYVAENNNDFKKYKVKLPINSAIKTPIDGVFCNTKKNAKKSAAFNACIELYKAKALDEHLLPVNIANEFIVNNLKWFPNWVEKDMEACKYNLKPGTNKMKRMVHIESPSYLKGVYPQVDIPSYLHVIHCVPMYSKLRDSNYETFDKLLRSNKEFGILTSNQIPPVSNFPIFLNFGDVNVQIKENVDVIYLNHENHKRLEQFHSKLFVDVLGVKNFIIRSFNNENNSYMVIPIVSSDNTYSVDWNVVDLNTFVETEPPTMAERKYKFYEEYLKISSVISPWYRNIVPLQRYIVTDVHYDMTPESAFPTKEYETYKSYFSDKYNIHVANKNQPMIKVKSLGVSKINYLIPRISCGKIDKRNEYIEILIPEFCIWHRFPSVYWLKALMLPTILYRYSNLLLATDLLVKVNTLCNIKFENQTIDAVKMDNFCGFNEQKKNIILPISEMLKCLESPHDDLADESINLPVDIERQANTTMLDVLNYHTFMYAMSKPISDNVKKRMSSPVLKDSKNDIEIEDSNQCDSDHEPVEVDTILQTVITELNILNFTNNEIPELSPLTKQLSIQNVGPKQSDILKVITPPFANDMFNYERMETYGDSFLKFAASLSLFDAYESENEGVLTELKMKLVGNRNLLYVGNKLNIGSYLKVSIFEPTMDWVPPCFGVPQQLIEIIKEGDLQSDVLHQILIPREDKLSGQMSNETWDEIESEILKFKKLSEMPMSDDDDDDDNGIPQIGHSQSDIFIHKQSVSDKMVADCVESLIGTYVYYLGVEGGFKLLHGLGIIPKEYIDTFKPKTNIDDDKYVGLNFSHILPGYEILERRIDYSFNHKHLLVQALTHPTHQHGFSECYQRLEFLGDAILDFLITTYIIEHCHNKTPGDITDIRSSLVNNITFASLSVRIGLHRFILAESLELTNAIDRFFEHQQKNQHKIGQNVLYLLEENNCYAAESVDVPKVLGDLFESLIGAIYLDCGRDLNFVWKMCYRFMENEIKEFCTNVPKNPIRILHETKLQPSFSKPAASNRAFDRGLGTMIQLDIILNHKNMQIFGFGQNKKEAKVAAAKMALKTMKKMLS